MGWISKKNPASGLCEKSSPTAPAFLHNDGRKKLCVRHSAFQHVFHNVFNNLKKLKEHSPKVIIFCATTKDCADMFEYIKSELSDDIMINGKSLINMYVKVTDSASKASIVEEFVNAMGTLRVVVATLVSRISYGVRPGKWKGWP